MTSFFNASAGLNESADSRKTCREQGYNQGGHLNRLKPKRWILYGFYKNPDGAAAFILRGRVPDSGRMHVHELPAAMMAATVHHGSYNTIGEAHEAILKWIEANGYQIVGPDREIYLYNTMPVRLDDPSYVTEIQYPVEKTVNGG